MTRSDLIDLINPIQELIAVGRQNRPGTAIKPRMITIHNTSNRTKGADARSHSKFVRNTGFYMTRDPQTNQEKKNWVSWHYTVDDKVAIQQLPELERAYHAGTHGNDTSIAIEICMHSDIDQNAANTRAARLVALLCHDLSIPIANVVTHKYWTGKNFPELLLSSWDQFKAEIATSLAQLSSAVGGNLEMEKSAFQPIAEDALSLCWEAELPLPAGKTVVERNPLSLVQQGFNDKFLSAGTTTLPVVSVGHPDLDQHLFIHHQNMSIYFNTSRKLALYSACNYDKEQFIPMGRSNAFREDNIGADHQLGDGFYQSKTIDDGPSSNVFDRGHLIARRYNQWGATEEEAKKGERDTYYFTTIHPQVKQLNQEEWEELESFIIEKGKLDVKQVSIIAGALLRANDPVGTYIDKFYQKEMKIQIPTVYWKVVYYQVDNELRKIAFLMSQKAQLKKLAMVSFEQPAEKAATRFMTDPFDAIDGSLKTFVVNSKLIAETCDLQFAPAKELYDREEPLEVVIEDNEATRGLKKAFTPNFLSFV